MLAGIVAFVHSVASAQEPEPEARESDPRESEPMHCARTGDARWVIDQTLALQIEPTGAELATSLGLCIPLVQGEGELFDYTHVEPGVSTQITFGYVQAGGYVELIPISFLVLRVAMHSIVYFPAAIDGTGYYPFPSYDVRFAPDDVPIDNAESAAGFNAIAGATLQIEVPIADPVSLLVVNDFGFEYWSLGDGPFYLNCRWDLILADSDSFLRNDAFLLAAIALDSHVTLQAGGYSTLRYVPASDYVAHHAGGLVAAFFDRLSGAIAELTIFASVGGYSHHQFRTGVTIIGGAFATYDLGRL